MSAKQVSLEDKYQLDSGRIFLTGIEALVRLPMLQHQRDQIAGLNTAGFITGYRGSPLGGLDHALWKAQKYLSPRNIHFSPGINEDLAATAVWGSQQVNMLADAKYDGVFSMWYGKGPGVDRSGDVFKHANAAGVGKYGGVLALAGDDHACKSSTLPHQSEYAFMDAMMPILNPAGVQEIFDLGIYGWALSRFSGCWVGFKAITETMDASASVAVDPERVRVVLPDEFTMPDEGLHIRWPDAPRDQELRLHQYKMYAALEFARVNRIDQIVLDSPQPRFGIVTTGKSYLDVRQALEDLGIDERLAAEIGLRLYKVGMSWPLEREGIRQFAEGLEEVLVVEEKRAVIENQLKEQLYNWREDVRPRIVGKFNQDGTWALPSAGELTPARIAQVIASRIGQFVTSATIERRLAFLEAKERSMDSRPTEFQRTPYFCSGCPHNTSTKVPEGSRALAGIGCHFMATWMDRNTETFTQMGGEGATWIGQAPYTETGHVFQNLGDGTYFHSGLLAIRATVASGVNITYKILYNDAVAMTGGQPIDGQLSVEQITHQLFGEGIRRICIVSDTPEVYRTGNMARGVTIHHRRELERVQLDLRETKGTSVMIYAQTCAAEKRRRRKRGLMPDPAKRVFINPAVCEGCGECGKVSNCLAIQPLETTMGRKRIIDQSACNKDFSCAEALCPSFVTVAGGEFRQTSAEQTITIPELPEPVVADSSEPYNIVIAGVGGTGVVTVGAILGMAAHMEGKGSAVLDMTGLAQKFGAVVSHVRIADRPDQIHASRIAAGGAHLLLGCDMVVAASFEALAKVNQEQTLAVINDHDGMPAAFTRQPDLLFPQNDLQRSIVHAVGENRSLFVNATRLATRLTGDAIMSNLIMIGVAVQSGAIPMRYQAVVEAIRLNGVAVEKNLLAFELGRWSVVDQAAVESLVGPEPHSPEIDLDMQQLLDERYRHLVDYQGRSHADRFADLVGKVQKAEQRIDASGETLSRAVAIHFHNLLAYKDEYEVARVLSDRTYLEQLRAQFDGPTRLLFNLAPTWLNWLTRRGLKPAPRPLGSWVLPLLRMLAKFRWLRGTLCDPFGYQDERRLERSLLRDYETAVLELCESLSGENMTIAIKLASLPDMVRGFGSVKINSAAEYRKQWDSLWDKFIECQQKVARAA